MNKKGFTLVELLAVIAILAILVIIALPNVLGMFNDAKKSSFTTETQSIYKDSKTEAMQYFMNNSGATSVTFTNVGENPNPLSLNGRSDITYCVTVDRAFNITVFKVGDASFKYAPDTVPAGEDKIVSNDVKAETGTLTACP